MKNTILNLKLGLLFMLCSLTLGAQQKGVAINKPSLDGGLVLDVSGDDGSTRLGVRFSPLDLAPQTTQLGSMYFDETLRTYRQWTGTAWQRMTGAFTINTSGQAAYSGIVRIDGDVGISRNPERALDVSGAIRASGGIAGATISTDGAGQLYAGFARIGEDNVTTAPGTSFNLQVWGDAWFRSSSSTGASTFTYIENLAVQQDGTNVWYAYEPQNNTFVGDFLQGVFIGIGSPSDNRLKDNIEGIPNALDKLTSLRGITYEWNTTAKDLFTEGVGKDGVPGPEQSIEEFNEQQAVQRAEARARYQEKETGLIAQDLQKVLPEAVVEAEDGYLRVKYGHLAGLFVEAIKEQQTIIDAQAERIRLLEAQQNSVLARLEKLEEASASKNNGQAED